MINSGAITVTAMLHAAHGARAAEEVLDRLSAAAGRQLVIDQAVYESERHTGHRNRAIAHLLLNFGMIPKDAEAALDVYFKQCSILVTCRDLAVMGATLANMGLNPITGQPAFDIRCVKDMLSVNVHVRDVRLFGSVGLPGGRTGQERRKRRGAGGCEPTTGHRHLLAAPRLSRQQLPRRRGEHRTGRQPRASRLRLRELRLELSGRNSVIPTRG